MMGKPQIFDWREIKGKMDAEGLKHTLAVITAICKHGFCRVCMDAVLFHGFRGTDLCDHVCKVSRAGREWHSNYKVIQRHIITLLHTPKATKTTHVQNVRPRAHTCAWRYFLCRRSYQKCAHALTHTHTLQHTRGKSGRSRSKKMWLKKNTQGHLPPHKQGISLPKTKRPEQPTHIQRNREGWKRLKKKGRGDQKTCCMGGKVEQNHSLL